MKATVIVQSKRSIGTRDAKIYGHFIEHFDDQIYGGVYSPSSPFADESGLRTDVLEAITYLRPPVLRWPGGCFVSAYHWQDGVGKNRQPSFDKAWRVEETNEFGTDEFIALCRRIGAEPYICTNAGTGTSEEMSNWVEYCNFSHQGKWARKRIENGYATPYHVKYWSIGNENYLSGEIGAKTPQEWGIFVRESAKMMKRVDPSIELMAASVPNLEWNLHLLEEAGQYLDWISIHGYWDPLWQENKLSTYETCMTYTMEIETQITTTKHILGTFGYLGRIKIAIDEWNLRGWHHPSIDSPTDDYLTPRKLNNLNESYTMADAVFSACFLNQCLRHCDAVGMANFAPLVNTRGVIYAYEGGIVLRPTYFVFALYAHWMADEVVDSWLPENEYFRCRDRQNRELLVPAIDIVATKATEDGSLRIAIVNRHPDQTIRLDFSATDFCCGRAILHSITAPSKDSHNDVQQPNVVHTVQTDIPVDSHSGIEFDVPPHSVHVLVVSA